MTTRWLGCRQRTSSKWSRKGTKEYRDSIRENQWSFNDPLLRAISFCGSSWKHPSNNLAVKARRLETFGQGQQWKDPSATRHAITSPHESCRWVRSEQHRIQLRCDTRITEFYKTILLSLCHNKFSDKILVISFVCASAACNKIIKQ